MIDPTALRVFIYDRLLERGLPPTIKEIGEHFRTEGAEAKRALADLKIGKTVLVDPKTGEIWMAGPFSAVVTSYRVIGSKAQWFANCAWDMLGVAVLAAEPVHIESLCKDCNKPMSLQVEPRFNLVMRPDDQEPTDANQSGGFAYLRLTDVTHFLVPARRWFDDIGFT